MSRIITMKNDCLTVTVSTLGAELQSVTGKDGHDYLWCGDASVWAGRAPIMFPICGGLKDNKYNYNGKEYSLTIKHGFAKVSEFEVVEEDDIHTVFRLSASDETRECYPFEFNFDVAYTLSGNSLLVEYRVDNTDKKPLYCAVGGHEAYATPEGIEDYKIVFENNETLVTNLIEGGISRKQETILKNGKELALKYDYFAIDALVFLDTKFKAVELVGKNPAHKVKVEFEGINNMLLWTKPDAKYICIEPWDGMGDFVDTKGILEEKEYITVLNAGKQYSRRHTITFGE